MKEKGDGKQELKPAPGDLQEIWGGNKGCRVHDASVVVVREITPLADLGYRGSGGKKQNKGDLIKILIDIFFYKIYKIENIL
jgi:hypothetical protein